MSAGLQCQPRSEIVTRSALVCEVETGIVGLVDDVSDTGNLVVQFDGSDPGKPFIEPWKRARMIMDSGGGHVGTRPPTQPTK